MPLNPSARLLADLRRANRAAFLDVDDRLDLTLGDVLDVIFCSGPLVYVCPHCTADPPEHAVCLGVVGGRTCQCAEGPHPLRRRRR